jgi:predicted dehydrogenase
MREPLELGLIGAGGFGAFCLEAYQEMAEVRVTAVADILEDRARSTAPEGAAVYPDYQALLVDPHVTIVAINTPPYLHARMAIEAANAGKHIFVEKPLATVLPDALEAIATAGEARVRLGINYVLRHHPLHRLALAVVESKALGQFQHWSLENFAADDNLLSDHWFWDLDRSGGIHVEHGVHFFDLCNQLSGRQPDHVSGDYQAREDGRIDRVSATLRYGNEALATFYHSFNQIGAFEQTTIRIGCTRGHIVIDGWIPTQLTLGGYVDESGLSILIDHFGERLKVIEQFDGAAATMAHGGLAKRVSAVVQATVEVPDRKLSYKRAIQSGMRDMVNAIHSDKPLQVSPDDAVQSLTVALVASNYLRE